MPLFGKLAATSPLAELGLACDAPDGRLLLVQLPLAARHPRVGQKNEPVRRQEQRALDGLPAQHGNGAWDAELQVLRRTYRLASAAFIFSLRTAESEHSVERPRRVCVSAARVLVVGGSRTRQIVHLDGGGVGRHGGRQPRVCPAKAADKPVQLPRCMHPRQRGRRLPTRSRPSWG